MVAVSMTAFSALVVLLALFRGADATGSFDLSDSSKRIDALRSLDFPNLTAEQRSFAHGLTLSRFMNAPNLIPKENPLSKLGHIGVVEGNGTVPVDSDGNATGAAISHMSFSSTSAVGMKQGLLPADSTTLAADVATQLASIRAILMTAYRKSRQFKTCLTNVRTSYNDVRKAQALAKSRRWAYARMKLQSARQEISICFKSIANVRSFRGQSYLKSADFNCIGATKAMTQLIYFGTKPPSPSTSPVTDVTAVYANPSQSQKIGRNNYRLKFDAKGGARLRSTASFTSGTFSASIMCPTGNSYGTNTAFYLSSPINLGNRNSIYMEVLYSDRRRMALNTIRNGTSGSKVVVDLGYDCGDSFHTYTIVWSPAEIFWYADKTLLRVLSDQGLDFFPVKTSMQLYMSLQVTTSVGIDEVWSPYVSMPDTPFYAEFNNVMATTPTPIAPALPASVKDSPLFPFGFDYNSGNMVVSPGTASITFKKDGSGGRWQSTVPYQYGAFSTEFKCAAGNTSGFVSSFYVRP